MSKKQEWLERGKKYIYPQMQDMWKHCVNIRCSDVYGGDELEVALNVMEALENGKSPKEAYEIIKKENSSGSAMSMAIAVIFDFSKRGPEFYYYVSKYIQPPFIDNKKSVQEMIYSKQQQNLAFERELSIETEEKQDFLDQEKLEPSDKENENSTTK